MKRFIACFLVLFLFINIFSLSEIMAKDKIAPFVTSSDPKNNDEISSLKNNSIKITFNENIVKGTTFSNVIIKNSNSKAVPVKCSIKGNILNLVPSVKLETNKYTLEIPAKAVKDIAGNFFQKKYVLVFKIKSNPANNKPSETKPAPTPETKPTTSPEQTTTPTPEQPSAPTPEPKPAPTSKVVFYCDFEPESPGMTWDILGDASNPLKAEIDTAVAKSGTHSIKIYGKAVGGNLKKVVPIDTTKRYQLTANVWNEIIETQGNEDGAFIVVAQLDAKGDIIPNTQKGFNWKTKLNGTRIMINGIEPVEGAVNIGIFIGLHGTGTFWVDDVTINELSD